MTDEQAKLLGSPVGFARGILGLDPYPWQEKALTSLANAGTTAVRSPNGGGRSSIVVAVGALWWLFLHRHGKVGITTCDSKQLNEQVLPAIEKHAAKLPWPKSVRSPYYRLENGTGGRLIAFCTDDASRVEGLHGNPDEPLLWIVDEAKSVPDTIMQGVDRCGYQHLLLASSPGIKQGRFYKTFEQQIGTCVTAGWTDCPHIEEAKKERIILEYGETHPFTRSCIFGEFMDQDEHESYLIGVDAVERCLRNPPPYKPGPRLAFCDFGAGKSENVVVLREGNRYSVEARWKEGNKLEACTRFIQHFRRLSLEPRQITGDASDAEMLGLLSEAGWGINRQPFGAPAYDKEVYTSWSAEAWVNLARMIDKCEIILPQNCPDMVSQLTTRKRTFNLAGKIGAEDKQIMQKKRGLPSPDIVDCLAGASAIRDIFPEQFRNPTTENSTLLQWVHGVEDQRNEWEDLGALGDGPMKGAYAGGLA